MNAKINFDPEVIEELVQRVQDSLDGREYSAYGVHTVLNLVLVANGMDKVRPQMMYNYAKNGLIVRGEKISGESLRKFSPREVAEFVVRFVLRHGGEIKFKTAANPDQLELDLESITE